MNQIIMILLISLLVLVHEAGHFLAARLCGVRVTRFGIGMPFGPSWRMFRWKNTDFYLHAFLFGGYVSFPDDAITNEEDKKDLNDNEILPPDSPELYENKTIGQKLLIVSAGVLMNVIFAVVLVFFCAMYYHKLPSSFQNVYFDSFSSKVSSNINNFELQKNDRIIKINNQKINGLYQLSFYAKNSRMFDGYVEKENYEKNLEKLKKLNPEIKDENALIEIGKNVVLFSLKPEEPLKINENVLKGLEKYKPEGEKLTQKEISLRDKIENKKEYKVEEDLTLLDFAKALSDSYKPMAMTVLRGDKEITFENIQIGKNGVLGILLKVEDVYTKINTPKEAIQKSFDYIYTTTKTMLFSLWQLIIGKVSASDMHGVIAVVKVGGDIIASKGFLDGILLTAMISINLAIMNILPIPALDGGHVMFLIIEKLTGKKPSREFSEKITNFFFFLLIVLMISICYNDILALVTKKF